MQPSTRRALRAVVVVLIAVNLALVGMAAYPLSEREPRPAADAFDQPDREHYRVAATITSGGDVAVGVEAAVSASGQRYLRVQQPNVVTEQYQNDSVDGVEVERTVATGPNAEQLRQQIEDDPDREIHSVDRADGTLTVIAVRTDPETDLSEGVSGPVSVVTQQLRLANYESAEASRQGQRTHLVPQAGWYRGSRPYRLTDVDGEVVVDSESNALYAASVRWTLTENTETYLHYLLNRPSGTDQQVTYQYDADPGNVEEPAWVDDVQDNRE